eukprot:TRINITY_DN50370_c0_g1_i1.p1 TRINITY_DN50370_c0_g1~~TRINITY_DN50370_c0_g1_i1.p1  ORF type:complete len:216 (-),score=47.48 TRINITY_DN50370_c0_g1_i1:34-612(-)
MGLRSGFTCCRRRRDARQAPPSDQLAPTLLGSQEPIVCTLKSTSLQTAAPTESKSRRGDGIRSAVPCCGQQIEMLMRMLKPKRTKQASHASSFEPPARAEVTEQASPEEEASFQAAQSALKTLTALDNDSLLKLYAHYKQATVGPATGSRPGVFEVRARAKYDAWAALRSMDASSAKKAYCALADEYVPGWR